MRFGQRDGALCGVRFGSNDRVTFAHKLPGIVVLDYIHNRLSNGATLIDLRESLSMKEEEGETDDQG